MNVQCLMITAIIQRAGSQKNRGGIPSILARKEWTDARSKASLSNARIARNKERITASVNITYMVDDLIIGTARVEREKNNASDTDLSRHHCHPTYDYCS